ncbi:MAG TPA: type III secretion system stator protein SctL [Bryobacteraceae bacterium]|nr:type III secretion system stator protein SctL [Bryobacteraceae bacterium]
MTANIIKVRANTGAFPASIKREAHEASVDARQILTDARAQAAQLIENAEQEKESIFAEASRNGHRAGLDKWNDTLVDTWKLREQFLSQNEAELVKLAIAIAGKIIGREVQSDPSLILQTARKAVKAASREKQLTIQVNPADEATLREQADSLRNLFDGSGDLVVTANSAITRGGCVVESELGIVDAQIATQLASLEKALLRRSNDDSR